MEGQSQLSCFTRILHLFKVHINEGGVGEISVSAGEMGTRRVHLVLDLKETSCKLTKKPTRNHDAHRPHVDSPPPTTKRRKPPSRRKRDHERKEAWIKKLDSRVMKSVDAPDADPGEASLMSLCELQQSPSEASYNPDAVSVETSLKSSGEMQPPPGEVSSASAQTGALEEYPGSEGDRFTTSSSVIERDGDDEDPPSAPEQRPGAEYDNENGRMDLKLMLKNDLPYWCTSDNCAVVNFSNVLDERTGVKCRFHPDSYKVITLRKQKSYSCTKCQGLTQFKRLCDFNYAIHRDIKFTNTNIMSMVSENMQ